MLEKYLLKEYGIKKEVYNLCNKAKEEIYDTYKRIEKIIEYNQYKVLKAMQNAGLSDRHFNVSTGYGYDDLGREVVEEIFAEVFNGEDSLVRPQLISGTHAISTALYGILRPSDEIISITGRPYDTIETVIGWNNEKEKGNGTLKDYGITYKQIELNENGEIDLQSIQNTLSEKTKLVYIQRSTGYGWRKAITIDDIKNATEKIKQINKDIIILVDNCYGEFLDYSEPTNVGVDLIAGSLIKNPGGGLAPMGGYIVGKKELVYKAGCRLASPGIAKETGATLGINRTLLQGLFLAPQVTGEALKTAILLSKVYKNLGYEVCPEPKDYRSDIIQAIKFNDAECVKIFCKAVQEAAPVDSFLNPEPWDMPGYNCPVIMAAGAFIQGSSIELSADAPMREPYIAYFQGGLTHNHGKIGIYLTLQRLYEAGKIKL